MSASSSIPPPGTTALVIDDEAPIRRLLRRMLESGECEVLEAEDAETGLSLIQRGTPVVDIVLTDWVMPGLDGHDVVEVLDRYRPGLWWSSCRDTPGRPTRSCRIRADPSSFRSRSPPKRSRVSSDSSSPAHAECGRRPARWPGGRPEKLVSPVSSITIAA